MALTQFKPKSMMANSSSSSSLDMRVSELVSELLNSAVSFHKLHLKVTGTGSFAAHKALNKLYDALPDHGDTIAETYQGAAEKLLSYKEEAPKTLNTVKEAISYCNDIKEMVTSLQNIMPHSEIVNELDNIKSTLNSIKYLLLFLS